MSASVKFSTVSRLVVPTAMVMSVLVITSCNDNFMKQKSSNESNPFAVGRTVVKPDGSVRQTTRADYSGVQVLTAAEGSAVAGAEIAFPNGSLAISALVSMGSGSVMASTEMASGLGIETTFTNTGVPVIVGSDPAQDTKSPFTLSIPLPSASTSLADETETIPTSHNHLPAIIRL